MADTFNPWANVPLTEAIPGGAGTTPQGDPTALSGMLSGVMNMPKHLIDAAKESAAHNYGPGPAVQSDSWVDPLPAQAAQTAMMLSGAGAPAAEAGAAGIFGGRLAQTADLKALQEAEKMRMHGMHPDDVWKDTGWARTPADEQWRFEIPDNKSRLEIPYLMQGERVQGSVDAGLDHPELLKAYPQIGDAKLDIMRQTQPENGVGLWQNNTASVIAPTQKLQHSILLHELQHGVQDIEGFSPGTNPNYWAGKIEQGLRNKPEILQGYDFNRIKNEADNLYHKTAGEVEARNTQLRQFMTAQQRRDLPPWGTQDVPFRDQLHNDRNADVLNALRQK